MAATDTDADVIERILCETARRGALPERFRTLTVFDVEHGQFLLVDEGWEGYRRKDNTWVHVELRDGKIYIHEDGTPEGIATDLMKAGIPASRIVLAFKHPSLRQDTPFAVA